MDKTFLTRKQLAEKLGKKPITIKRWEKDGLPVIKVSSQSVLYDLDEVAVWLKGKEQTQ